MGSLVKGEVVVLEFPFSDLTNSKRRPALVLATLGGDDVILCQITTMTNDADSVPLDDVHFVRGRLSRASNIRPNKLFTADATLVYYSVGLLKPVKVTEVISKLVQILNR
jgi:PemK-like, MazF-like toxin of type II toxin-antitoxin system